MDPDDSGRLRICSRFGVGNVVFVLVPAELTSC